MLATDPVLATFPGPGGTWALVGLEWRQTEGDWALSAEVAPARLRTPRSVDPGLIRAICGALLVALPMKPDDLEGRREIYRADLWLVSGEDPDGNRTYFSPHPLPVGVVEGACQDAVGGQYFPVYPEPLEGIRMTNVDHRTGPEDEARVFVFVVDPEVRGDRELDAEALCDAVLADPVVTYITDAAELPASRMIALRMVDTKINALGGLVKAEVRKEWVLEVTEAGCRAPSEKSDT